ncbi:DUF975 family protein [Oenococcus sp.]|uniref:DUF975 family protein n=1 Tax=Oenococcus sp. TaxID=1979414 RepID=UPI0039ED5108
MERRALKKEAKTLLNQHFPFFLLLFLPALIFSWLSAGSNVQSPMYVWTNWDNISGLFSIISGFLLTGAMLTAMDSLRKPIEFTESFKKSFRIFENGQYFIGFICISLLQLMFTVLWMLLFIVPGLIKSISYSQAFYIYRDHLDNNDPIGYLEAITESRKLMNGYKADYFVLYLSFILWGVLVLVTLGIASIWVAPYINLTLANFYNHLSGQTGSAETTDENTVLPNDA